MTNNLIKYKRIIWALSIAVVILILSNYSALRKLDLIIRAPFDKIEEIEEPVFQDSVVIDDKKNANIIVLVIDDFGYRNDSISDGFLDLPVPITCAVLPGHNQSSRFAKKAINAGKEVIVHMPMQSAITSSGEDEFKLKIGMTSEEIEWRLNEALNEIPEAVGINNHQGSKATTDGKVMAVVASVLKNKNKFFLDSRTSSKTVGENTMRSAGVPTARRHIFLDNDLSIENISKQLDKLVTVAEKKGLAIGIGHVKGNTLKVLEEEIPALVEQGFEFKFLSQVVD
ncbi:MAG: hypothetical protein CBC68_00785 [Candidatus Marinimicrobia bacterium TMED108]|nr:MAG: hypothetical protein CBC68_00785 [Candidatus Marinimicrobia bacterium TMED108]